MTNAVTLEYITAEAIATPRPLPSDRHPAAVYLAGLADGMGRVTMRSSLHQVARLLSNGALDAEGFPWHQLRFQHLAALRTRLAEAYAPATANKMLSAVRGTLRSAWRLGLIPTDDFQRAVDVGNVRGSRLPSGRALERGEMVALFRSCSNDKPAEARDAAAFALMFGGGMRRGEAVTVTLDDYDPDTGAIRIIGKSNKQRTVYATNGGADALDAWISIRGNEPGPLLCPVTKSGKVVVRAMTSQALMVRLKVRCQQANIKPCSPHDLRRTFVSELLEAGADIAHVQHLAGHASPVTTSRYDRRPEAARRRAASMIHVPFRAA